MPLDRFALTRLPRTLAPALIMALALLSPSAAAFDGWDTGAPVLPPAQASSWGQEWAVVAISDDGERVAAVWETEIGHEVKLRFFDRAGAPLSAELLVNEGFTGHIQDEPRVAMDADGRTLVCWSDRNGYDGEGMGVFGRVYDATGAPLDTPFVISQGTAQSQWEPMPRPLPGGGWVVAFNGEDDGEAWFRRLEADGTPLAGDVNLATFHNNAQVDAAVTVDAEGRLFTVFVDYGGHGGLGNGTTVFVRRFLPDGTALDASEAFAHETHMLFDQIDPRVASNRLGGAAIVHWVVWQDGGNDGDGQGVFGRRFGGDGLPLGPVFGVSTTVAGDQLLPEVSCDHVGNAIVTWEDHSTGTARVLARVFLADGTPDGGEFVVDPAAGPQHRPSVRLAPDGEQAWFSYEGPGLLGSPSPAQDTDAWLRPWHRPAIRFSGPGTLGTTVFLDHDLPVADGLLRLTLASFGDEGVPLPDGRALPLTLDVLFEHSLLFPANGLPFLGMSVLVPPAGANVAGVVLPSNPGLVGIPLRFAALTLKLDEVGLTNQLRHVSRAATLVLE